MKMFRNRLILNAVVSKNPTPPNLAGLTRDELIAIIIKQGKFIAEMEKRIDELSRKAGRQASPFSKGEPKTDPKPPGRKRGQGPFTRRASPPEQSTDVKNRGDDA